MCEGVRCVCVCVCEGVCACWWCVCVYARGVGGFGVKYNPACTLKPASTSILPVL